MEGPAWTIRAMVTAMNTAGFWRVCVLGLMLFPADVHARTPQVALDRFADHLGYRFTVLSNHAACPDQPALQVCYSAVLDLAMPKTMPQGAWSLYLGFVEHVLPPDSGAFTLTNINGSFYRLTPRPGMVEAGKTYRLKLTGPYHFFSPFILMPNAYVAQDGLKPHLISATRPGRDPQSHLEELP
ncbi:MAG: carbohydate-binding domain-containing protein, partial [Rhizomicrobium sp.]